VLWAAHDERGRISREVPRRRQSDYVLPWIGREAPGVQGCEMGEDAGLPGAFPPPPDRILPLCASPGHALTADLIPRRAVIVVPPFHPLLSLKAESDHPWCLSPPPLPPPSPLSLCQCKTMIRCHRHNCPCTSTYNGQRGESFLLDQTHCVPRSSRYDGCFHNPQESTAALTAVVGRPATSTATRGPPRSRRRRELRRPPATRLINRMPTPRRSRLSLGGARSCPSAVAPTAPAPAPGTASRVRPPPHR
jgi:hypothetical protein